MSQIEVPAAVVTGIASILPSADRSAEVQALSDARGTLVFRIGGSIVRVPHDDEGARRQGLEIHLLPALAGRLPAAVAGPITVAEPGPNLPFGAVAYPMLPGRPLAPGDEETWPSIAGDLAHLLASIHGTPAARATAAGVPTWNAADRMPSLLAAAWPTLEPELTPGEREAFTRRWADGASALALHPPLAVLCHGDPWYDNLLIDESSGRIVAVLDFEDAVIADAALDLAAVFHMGDAFGEAVVRGYEERRGRDASLRGRVGAHRLVREVAGLVDALTHDPTDVGDQVDEIRSLLAQP